MTPQRALETQLEAVRETERVVEDGEDRRRKDLRRVEYVPHVALPDVDVAVDAAAERVRDARFVIRFRLRLQIVNGQRIRRRTALMTTASRRVSSSDGAP